MKDYKKKRKTFIGILFLGIVLLVEAIVMGKLEYFSKTICTIMICAGTVIGLIGVIGIVITSKKAKEQAQQSLDENPQEQTPEAQTVTENTEETRETAETAPTTDNSKRVSGKVALSGGDSWRLKTFAILTVMYLAILVVALVGYFTAFGLPDGDGAIICKAVCLAYAFITPSYFLYLGYGNPFRLPKGASTAIAVFGIVAMVICFVLSFVTLSHLPAVENGFLGFVQNIFIYLAIACAVVGYGVVYGWFCREASAVWYLGCGIALTVLFPVVAALLVAVFVIGFIIGAIRWILSSLGVIAGDTALGKGFISGWTGRPAHKNAYTYTDENGYSHTVYSDNGTDFYNSDGSYAGRSDDNGGHMS